MRVCARVLAAALMAGAIAVAVSFPAFVDGHEDARPVPLAPPASQHETIRLAAPHNVGRQHSGSIRHGSQVQRPRPADLASSAPVEPGPTPVATHETAVAPTVPRPMPTPATPPPPAAPSTAPAIQPPPAAPPPPDDQTRELAAAPPPAERPAVTSGDDDDDDQGEDEQGDGDRGQDGQHEDGSDHGHDGGHGSGHDK